MKFTDSSMKTRNFETFWAEGGLFLTQERAAGEEGVRSPFGFCRGAAGEFGKGPPDE